MHDIDFEHEHAQLTEADKAEMAKFIWSQESVELNTVGIDIGSSTSHLLFAKVTLQRQSQGLSSRFVVTNREVIWRSPIMLTPFVSDGTIDAHALDHFIHDAYKQAGMKRADVDSGAVILTGEAIKRKKARAIDELFADQAGKFVCAGCGHDLFRADTKFESGTGWPSFFDPMPGAVGTTEDRSFFMLRTEVHCSQCGGHLGHVFPDGPAPTGQRYCMNGVSLKFVPDDGAA